MDTDKTKSRARVWLFISWLLAIVIMAAGFANVEWLTFLSVMAAVVGTVLAYNALCKVLDGADELQAELTKAKAVIAAASKKQGKSKADA